MHTRSRLIAVTLLFGMATAVAAESKSVAVPCESRTLDFGQTAIGWKHQPLSKLKRDTVYTLKKTDGRTVLHAAADGSASLYVARFQQVTAVPAAISWRWKTDALVPDADNRDKRREDAPLRVLVAFDGDHTSLSEEEQKRFKRAKKISGVTPPYAVLMYIWSDLVDVETIIPFAHSSRVKMLVVASGANGLGKWQTVRRNLAEDYRRAYGAEPGPLLGIAVMTDTDNTNGKALGQYADIRFDCPGT